MPGAKAKATFLGATSKLFGGAALGQLAMLSAAPLLGRLYAPEAFGHLSIFLATVTLLGTAASFRLEYAFPIAVTRKWRSALLGTALSATFLVTTVCAITLLVLLVAYPSLRMYSGITLIPAGVCVLGIYNIGRLLSVCEGKYGSVAKADFSRSLLTAVCQVGMGLVQPSATSLAAGQVIGYGPAFRYMFDSAALGLARKTKWLELIAVLHRFRRFAFLSTPASLLNAAGWNLVPLLIGVIYTWEFAGLYLMAERLAPTPLQLLGRSVSDTYLGHLKDSIRKRGPESDEPLTLFRSIRNKLALYIGFPTLIGLPLAAFLMPSILGHSWSGVTPIMQIMAPSWALRVVTAPLAPTLNVIERQDILLAWDSLRILGLLLVLGLLAMGDISFIFGILSLSILSACLYSVLLYQVGKSLRHHVHGAISDRETVDLDSQ